MIVLNKLVDKGLCALTCRILLLMHIAQNVNVRWNSDCSNFFVVKNGVKQGGILSPVLLSAVGTFESLDLVDVHTSPKPAKSLADNGRHPTGSVSLLGSQHRCIPR